MSSAFKERDRDDIIMIDVFPVQDSVICSSSLLRAPVRLIGKECGCGPTRLVINDRECKSVQLWKDTAPNEVLMRCHCDKEQLHVYNIWDCGEGSDSQSYSSGMVVEELTDGRRYSCNDFGFETNFDNSSSSGCQLPLTVAPPVG